MLKLRLSPLLVKEPGFSRQQRKRWAGGEPGLTPRLPEAREVLLLVGSDISARTLVPADTHPSDAELSQALIPWHHWAPHDPSQDAACETKHFPETSLSRRQATRSGANPAAGRHPGASLLLLRHPSGCLATPGTKGVAWGGVGGEGETHTPPPIF